MLLFGMLPAVAFIVAAYACYRIISDALRGPSIFPNRALYFIALAIGILALLFIVFNCVDVYHAGTTEPTP
jgi:hypothetical protein